MIVWGWEWDETRIKKIEAHSDVDISKVEIGKGKFDNELVKYSDELPCGRWFVTFGAAQRAAIEELSSAISNLQTTINNIRKQRLL